MTGEKDPHIRNRRRIILPRPRPIWRLLAEQQRTPIERRRQARNHRVPLRITPRRERPRRARKDVPRARLLERPCAAEVQEPIRPHLPVYLAPLRLRVDRELLVAVRVPDAVHVLGPIFLEPGGVEQEGGIRAENAQGAAVWPRDDEAGPATAVFLRLRAETFGDGVKAVGWEAGDLLRAVVGVAQGEGDGDADEVDVGDVGEDLGFIEGEFGEAEVGLDVGVGLVEDLGCAKDAVSAEYL